MYFTFILKVKKRAGGSTVFFTLHTIAMTELQNETHGKL
jgi:hypothetical protein